MKGIIFNITESFISEKCGEDTLEEIMSLCNLQTRDPFVGPGTYPDTDLMQIITIAAEKVQLPANEFLKNLGRYSFFKLAERYLQFVAPYTYPKDFLKTVHDVIHLEVAKLYLHSETPKFFYRESDNGELVMTYFSKRKLYSFAEGLLEGVGEYFNHPIRQSRTVYQINGEEYCDFKLSF